MLNSKDLQLLKSKGINEEQLYQQIELFKKGFPYLKLYASASPNNGVYVPTKADLIHSKKAWEMYLKKNCKIIKFVPASGAASRMFKNLYEFLDGQNSFPDNDFITFFFRNINKFAFYDILDEICLKNDRIGVNELISLGEYKKIIEYILNDNGLNYGNKPKGLLLFHSYLSGNRTPFEEHLVEGALYAASNDGNVNIHFTVSPEHISLFEIMSKKMLPIYEKLFNVKYHVTFSLQKASTDTIAVDENNLPFRTQSGSMLFRPGGHGALIENLNELDGDIVFIKNIDNVVPDNYKGDIVTYKQLLAGTLVQVQQKIFNYLKLLDSGLLDDAQLDEIISFLEDVLCIKNPNSNMLERDALLSYIRKKLNRPIRVCGMVKNVGEPGGGPFWAYNNDNTISLQILESSQIDKQNKSYIQMFNSGSYFNPVDIVCGIKDYKGKHFNLTDFVDSNTGFISSKSKNGRSLKALELPGLWNGAMSDWNTLFIEVPLTTFNPVKTVNDLLKEQHQ